MNALRLTLNGVSKEFSRRLIFRGISASLGSGESLAITGRNGSGKSTLVKVIAGLLSPTRGTIEYSEAGRILSANDLRDHLGLVSPYLQMYDEFSASENLQLLSMIRSDTQIDDRRLKEVLMMVGLWERRSDYVRTYSSGMKQRLKYAFAIAHRPSLLILDEPTSNLDSDGIGMVKGLVEDQKKKGLLIVATNDASEAEWCAGRIDLTRV